MTTTIYCIEDKLFIDYNYPLGGTFDVSQIQQSDLALEITDLESFIQYMQDYILKNGSEIKSIRLV